MQREAEEVYLIPLDEIEGAWLNLSKPNPDVVNMLKADILCGGRGEPTGLSQSC